MRLSYEDQMNKIPSSARPKRFVPIEEVPDPSTPDPRQALMIKEEESLNKKKNGGNGKGEKLDLGDLSRVPSYLQDEFEDREPFNQPDRNSLSADKEIIVDEVEGKILKEKKNLHQRDLSEWDSHGKRGRKPADKDKRINGSPL